MTSHTCASGGSCTITLTVTDDDGLAPTTGDPTTVAAYRGVDPSTALTEKQTLAPDQ